MLLGLDAIYCKYVRLHGVMGNSSLLFISKQRPGATSVCLIGRLIWFESLKKRQVISRLIYADLSASKCYDQ